MNLQKDIFKEFLLKSSVRDKSKITRCNGYYIDYKCKKIYLIHKLYENNLCDLLLDDNDLPYDRRLVFIKDILNLVESLNADKINNLNLTLENIKITKKKKLKLASLKNGIKLDSDNNFLNEIYSKYHFGSIFNSKINFPPEFYDLKNKTIKFYNFGFEGNQNNMFSGIDVWSFGVIVSLMFSNKNSLKPWIPFSNMRDKNQMNNGLRSFEYEIYDLVDDFYIQKKLLPEALFKNFSCSNNYIQSIVIGIIRYNLEERPLLRDVINLFKNL